MNGRQLQKLGVPQDCVREAITAIQLATSSGAAKSKGIKNQIKSVLDDPRAFLEDEHLGALAKSLIEDRDFVRPEPVSYQTWGEAGIDKESHAQMRQACSVPVAVAGALMPDASPAITDLVAHRVWKLLDPCPFGSVKSRIAT